MKYTNRRSWCNGLLTAFQLLLVLAKVPLNCCFVSFCRYWFLQVLPLIPRCPQCCNLYCGIVARLKGPNKPGVRFPVANKFWPWSVDASLTREGKRTSDPRSRSWPVIVTSSNTCCMKTHKFASELRRRELVLGPRQSGGRTASAGTCLPLRGLTRYRTLTDYIIIEDADAVI